MPKEKPSDPLKVIRAIDRAEAELQDARSAVWAMQNNRITLTKERRYLIDRIDNERHSRRRELDLDDAESQLAEINRELAALESGIPEKTQRIADLEKIRDSVIGNVDVLKLAAEWLDQVGVIDEEMEGLDKRVREAEERISTLEASWDGDSQTDLNEIAQLKSAVELMKRKRAALNESKEQHRAKSATVCKLLNVDIHTATESNVAFARRVVIELLKPVTIDAEEAEEIAADHSFAWSFKHGQGWNAGYESSEYENKVRKGIVALKKAYADRKELAAKWPQLSSAPAKQENA